jgi:hypothetical protein
MEVNMFRYFTVLSLVLFFSFSLFAQDLMEQKSPLQKNLNGKSGLLRGHVLQGSTQTSNIIKDGDPNKPNVSLNVLPYNSTSGNGRAPNGKYRFQRAIYLITPAEMAAAGFPNPINFTDIWFEYTTAPNVATSGTLNVWLQNTTDVTNLKSTTFSTTGMTQVNNNTSFTLPAAGYVDVTFTSPTFTYNGGGLYVAFEYLVPTSTLATTTVTACNTDLVNGFLGYQANTSGTTLAASSFRPDTWLDYAFTNDASVMEVYTLGKLPIPYATPHVIKAAVQNNGDNTLTNVAVTLSVTGANTFSDVQTIDTLLAGYYTEVTFANYTPTNAGVCTLTVSVPSDSWNANNSKTITNIIDYDAYAYSLPPFAQSGGVGFTGATGQFCGKFSTNAPTTINQIGVNFTSTGVSYQLGIWDATGAGGTPGTLLYTSPAYTTAIGQSTKPVSPAQAVSGDFYVGVLQNSTTNCGFAYQSENPIRSGYFYYNAGAGWTDFAPGSPFRLMVEPRLTIANDVGPSTIDNPVGASYVDRRLGLIAPKATIANFGTANQTFNVTMNVFDTTTLATVYTSTKSVTINSGLTKQVTFDSTFNPVQGVYTAKCYTSLGTDGSKTNDTITVTFSEVDHIRLGLGLFIEGFTTGVTMVSDTVTVEIRNSVSPYALVQSNKTVLSTGGIAYVNFTNGYLTAPYYIVVKHRNSIETWSATAETFSAYYLVYDFRSATSMAYGSNMVLKSGYANVYSGDVNQDGLVDSGDLGTVDNDNANYVAGYVSTDCNGDGIVDSSDLGIVDNNNAGYVGAVVPPGAPATKVVRQVNNIK